MSDGEFKKYDSDHNYINWSARLTKDAEVKEGDRTRVKVTFVATSRNENHHDLWITADVNEGQVPLAAYLKKGDVVAIEGFLYGWGETNMQLALNFARLHVTGELIAKLKERGFTPGSKATGKTAAKTTKPAAKRPAPKRPTVELPPEDESESTEDLPF